MLDSPPGGCDCISTDVDVDMYNTLETLDPPTRPASPDTPPPHGPYAHGAIVRFVLPSDSEEHHAGPSSLTNDLPSDGCGSVPPSLIFEGGSGQYGAGSSNVFDKQPLDWCESVPPSLIFDQPYSQQGTRPVDIPNNKPSGRRGTVPVNIPNSQPWDRCGSVPPGLIFDQPSSRHGTRPIDIPNSRPSYRRRSVSPSVISKRRCARRARSNIPDRCGSLALSLAFGQGSSVYDPVPLSLVYEQPSGDHAAAAVALSRGGLLDTSTDLPADCLPPCDGPQRLLPTRKGRPKYLSDYSEEAVDDINRDPLEVTPPRRKSPDRSAPYDPAMMFEMDL